MTRLEEYAKSRGTLKSSSVSSDGTDILDFYDVDAGTILPAQGARSLYYFNQLSEAARGSTVVDGKYNMIPDNAYTAYLFKDLGHDDFAVSTYAEYDPETGERTAFISKSFYDKNPHAYDSFDNVYVVPDKYVRQYGDNISQNINQYPVQRDPGDYPTPDKQVVDTNPNPNPAPSETTTKVTTTDYGKRMSVEEILSTPYDQLPEDIKKHYGDYVNSYKMGAFNKTYSELSKQTTGTAENYNIDYDRISAHSNQATNQDFAYVSDKYKGYWGDNGQQINYKYDEKTGNYVFLETQNGSGQQIGLGWTDQRGINKLHQNQALEATEARLQGLQNGTITPTQEVQVHTPYAKTTTTTVPSTSVADAQAAREAGIAQSVKTTSELNQNRQTAQQSSFQRWVEQVNNTPINKERKNVLSGGNINMSTNNTSNNNANTLRVGDAASVLSTARDSAIDQLKGAVGTVKIKPTAGAVSDLVSKVSQMTPEQIAQANAAKQSLKDMVGTGVTINVGSVPRNMSYYESYLKQNGLSNSSNGGGGNRR